MKGWQGKSFDEKFGSMFPKSIEQAKLGGDLIKSFITSLLLAIKDEVGKEKKEQLDKNDPDNYGACYAIGGHNHALTKVEDIISKAIGSN